MLDLSDGQLAIVRALLARHLPTRAVRAFGSRTTGSAKAHSDLDLVVMGEAPITDLVHAELMADLEESDLPFRVDLVPWRDTPPTLRRAIATQSIEVHCPSGALTAERLDHV